MSEERNPAPVRLRRWSFAFLQTRRGAGLALGALIAAHVLLNLLWLHLDQHVIRIDEEFHASAGQDYYFAFVDPSLHGLGGRLRALADIESPYPPLVHVLGGLSALIFGYSIDTVALPNTIDFALVILGTYLIARRLFTRGGALLAAAVCSLIPALFGGSRYVALENLVSVFSVWGLYFILASDNFKRWPYVVAFGVLNGLAILTKPNAFVYYLVPAAIAYGCGLIAALRARQRPEILRHLARGLVCVLLTLLVAAPWFLYHREYLQDFWMGQHKGGKTPFTFTQGSAVPSAGSKTLEDIVRNPQLPKNAQPEPYSPANASPTPDAKPKAPAAAPQDTSGWHFHLPGLLQREWHAYAVLIVNNGAFLPLTVLGTAGLLLGAWRYRRNRAFWLVLAWFTGAYVLNTLLFRFINPRYAMPFLPPLAIGAAVVYSALPHGRARALYAAPLLLLLALQYVNISFVNSSRLNWWVPVLQSVYRVNYFKDHGLALTKSQIITGTYCFREPAQGENYVARGFRAMTEHEKALHHAPGREVKYVSLARQNNFGGFRNMEGAYWPEPNPLLLDSLRGKPEDQYKFTRVGRFTAVQDALPYMGDADYAVVILDVTETTLSEGPHHHFFTDFAKGAQVKMLDFFFTPAYGLLPAGMVAVFGKEDAPPAPSTLSQVLPATEEALIQRAMDLLGSRNLDATPDGMPPAERTERDAQLAELLPRLKPAMNLSPNIDLVNLAIDQPYSGWFRLRLLFHINHPPSNNWRIFFHGEYDPRDAYLLPEPYQGERFLSWNFNPPRPTTTWQPGEFILCSREFACPPIRMKNLSIGFFRQNNEMEGKVIETGPQDLRVLPVSGKL